MNGVWDALKDGTRRKILTLLKKRPLSAGEIGEQFPIAASTLSHHLSVLYESGLVEKEKRAQTVIYSLNTTVVQELVKSVANLFGKE